MTRPEVTPLGAPAYATEPDYRFILVEKPPAGDPWPWSHEELAARIDGWRHRQDAVILRDDETLFFAELASRRLPVMTP